MSDAVGPGQTTTGKLYLCATPIGNLQDVTLRVLEILREADLVAAEDTRHTRRLFARYDIHTPMLSYREENRDAAGARIIRRLEDGQTVALVSNAGMPGISDPGQHLVALCVERGISLEALPGPNAALTALVISGLPTARFSFEGFLPRKTGARRKALEALARDERTLLFHESPSRVVDTLADIMEVLGDRRIALARELTKKFETVLRGTVSSVLSEVAAGAIKGEIVLVVEGAPAGAVDSIGEEAAVDEVMRLKAQGLSLKEAVAVVVEEKAPGMSRSALYNAALKRSR
ncbi:MAG TPA: 16S rRNA (cytidine(1402)-2'-O)-methyltransferase [Candidatus Anoxymicrobiaceae bacterium]